LADNTTVTIKDPTVIPPPPPVALPSYISENSFPTLSSTLTSSTPNYFPNPAELPSPFEPPELKTSLSPNATAEGQTIQYYHHENDESPNTTKGKCVLSTVCCI